MMKAGVDFFTSGNWTLHRPEINPWLEDPNKPVNRPANYPAGTPGRGYKIVATPFGKILVASLLGQVVGYIDHIVDNPLKIIDQILEETKDENLVARIGLSSQSFYQLLFGHNASYYPYYSTRRSSI